MEFLKSHKNIFIGIGLVVVLFIAYSFVKPDAKTAQESPIVSVQAAVSAPSASRDIIALIVDLKAIKIKRDFFSDPAFRSLLDFSTPIPDEPRGRVNPFAPVSAGEQAIPSKVLTQ